MDVQATGEATPSLTKDLIERLQRKSGRKDLSPEDEELARNVTGLAYAGILLSLAR